jgi:bacteriorhodopsin
MDRQEIFDIVIWGLLLVIIVFLVWIIKLASGSGDQVLVLAYFGCGLVAAIVISLLILVLIKPHRKRE